MTQISNERLDQILAEVGEMAEALAKSEPPKDDKDSKDMKKDDQPPSEPKEPKDEEKPESEEPAAPPAAEEQPSQDAPPAEEPPAEAPPSPEGEPGAPEEDMGQDLSDEELQQIYGSMDPQELERHYMVIRQCLQGHYDQADQSAEQPPAAPAPEQAPPQPEMGKGEAKISEGTDNKDFPQPRNGEQPSIAKSENEALKAELAEVKGQLAKVVTALEKSIKPARKSVAGVEFIRKSEGEGSSNLSKEEKKTKVKEFMAKGEKLTSEDRKAINSFFLYGEEEDKIDKIIGGK